MSGTQRLHELLDALDVRPGALVYLHTSFSRLNHLEITAETLIAEITQRLGRRGTLVMPSFAWNLDKTARPWKGYRDYFATRPPFDVRQTPANIGFVPEVFRKLEGVRRSANYWWPVCARGEMAYEITYGQQTCEHPFGPGSSFDRMRLHDVRIVGLGVTLNTTTLALVADYQLGTSHPQQVFTTDPQSGMVVDETGTAVVTRDYWLLPDIVRQIKPAAMIEASPWLASRVARADFGETIQFAYRYQDYHREALRLGQAAAAAGRAVPWLPDVPLQCSPRLPRNAA